MACSHPIIALDLGIDEETGKRRIKIKQPHLGEGLKEFRDRFPDCVDILYLPCGKCVSCKMAKRREWSLRCALESLYYQDISFITLTYDQAHYKTVEYFGLNKVKSDFQAFIKGLRNKYRDDPGEIRYFGCIEKGFTNNRYHIHVIVYGYFPKDCIKTFTSETNNACYRSMEVSDLWDNKGFCSVQYFDPKEASYVAGYVDKKMDDEVCLMMSKRPGIGYKWLEEHKEEVAHYYKVVGDFGSIKSAKPPRYFTKLAEDWNLDLREIQEKVKEIARINNAQEMQVHGFLREEELMKHHDYFARKRFSKFKRGDCNYD